MARPKGKKFGGQKEKDALKKLEQLDMKMSDARKTQMRRTANLGKLPTKDRCRWYDDLPER